MNVAEWQQRLERTFLTDVELNLYDHLLDSENAFFLDWQNHLYGSRTLSKSFNIFLLDTLNCINKSYIEGVQEKDFRFKAYLNLISLCRRFRGCEILCYQGYPEDGLSLLREIKDRAIIFSGINQGLTSFKKIYGHSAFENSNIPEDKKLFCSSKEIKNEERKFFEIYWKKLQLANDEKEELEAWQKFFNWEVHGQRLTLAGPVLNWLKSNGPFPIYPEFSENNCAMYINRSHEVSWLLHRTLPVFQKFAHEFGSEWGQKWKILDESFNYMVASLEEIGKPIGKVLAAIIPKMTPFSPSNFWLDKD